MFAAIKNWASRFVLSIRDVSVEERETEQGGIEYRISFDSIQGRVTLPWIDRDAAQAILSKLNKK